MVGAARRPCLTCTGVGPISTWLSFLPFPGTGLDSAYDRRVETRDPRVGEQVASVAASLEPRITELITDIRDLIQRDIPKLDGDTLLTDLLDASVEENIVTVLHMLRHSIVTAHGQAPTAALDRDAIAGAS